MDKEPIFNPHHYNRIAKSIRESRLPMMARMTAACFMYAQFLCDNIEFDGAVFLKRCFPSVEWDADKLQEMVALTRIEVEMNT